MRKFIFEYWIEPLHVPLETKIPVAVSVQSPPIYTHSSLQIDAYTITGAIQNGVFQLEKLGFKRESIIKLNVREKD